MNNKKSETIKNYIVYFKLMYSIWNIYSIDGDLFVQVTKIMFTKCANEINRTKIVTNSKVDYLVVTLQQFQQS